MALWTLMATIEAENLGEAWNAASAIPLTLSGDAPEGLLTLSLYNDENEARVSASWVEEYE